MIILQINNAIMKQLINYLFIGTLLVSCSPKYTELNDQGFGGGFQSFKKADSHSESKLEKLNEPGVENEKQFSKNIDIEPENLPSSNFANPEISRYTSLKIHKANHKSKRLLQFKEQTIQNPKLGNIIEKLTFKRKTQKKNDNNSKVGNVWFKIFVVLLSILACLTLLALFLLLAYLSSHVAYPSFIADYFLGWISFIAISITLMLWFISLFK